jgi:hypothetical protein
MVEISIILYLLFIIDFIGERKRKHERINEQPKNNEKIQNEKNGWKLKRIGTNVGKEKKNIFIRPKPKGTRLIGSGGHIIDFRKKTVT